MENIIRINRSLPLKGTVSISGAKNAAVAIIPATILAQGPCVLENVPPLTDVRTQCEILSALGAEVQWLDSSTISVDTAQIKNLTPPEGLAEKLRASYYFMGALLGRFGSARTGLPGGCKIGPRPIDQPWAILGLSATARCICRVERKKAETYILTWSLWGQPSM